MPGRVSEGRSHRASGSSEEIRRVVGGGGLWGHGLFFFFIICCSYCNLLIQFKHWDATQREVCLKSFHFKLTTMMSLTNDHRVALSETAC